MDIPKIRTATYHPGIFDTFMYQFIEVTTTQVLYRGKPIVDKNKKVLPIDAASFECLSLGYFADKNTAYGMTIIVKSNSEKFYLTPIPQLDKNSFEPINMYYAKDKNNTYFAANGKVINGIDFKILSRNIEDEQSQESILSEKSKYRSDIILNDTQVYYRGKLIKDAEPNSFCQVGRHWYKDRKRVYFSEAYQIIIHNEFDPKTFISFGHNGTDKFTSTATVIYNKAPESLVSYGPFKDFFESHPELSDYWYFKAKKNSIEQEKIEAISLGYGFYKRGEEIFCKKRSKDEKLTRILDTDTTNFSLLSKGYATNGEFLFLLKEEFWSHYTAFRNIKINPKQNLEILSDAWVYDGTHFYYKACKKFKADKASFVVLNHFYAYDKDGLILEGVRKKNINLKGEVKVIGGAYLKIGDEFYYMAKSRKKRTINDSKVKIINDFVIIGANGCGFNHGKFRKYIGDFNKFEQLENGNWGDGTLEWKIGPAGLEAV